MLTVMEYLASGGSTTLNAVFTTINQVIRQLLQVEGVPSPPSFVSTSVLDISNHIGQFGDVNLAIGETGISQTHKYIQARAA